MCRSASARGTTLLCAIGGFIGGLLLLLTREGMSDSYICVAGKLKCEYCSNVNLTEVGTSGLEAYVPSVDYLIDTCNISVGEIQDANISSPCCCGAHLLSVNQLRCPVYGVLVVNADYWTFYLIVSSVCVIIGLLYMQVFIIFGCIDTNPGSFSIREKLKNLQTKGETDSANRE